MLSDQLLEIAEKIRCGGGYDTEVSELQEIARKLSFLESVLERHLPAIVDEN